MTLHAFSVSLTVHKFTLEIVDEQDVYLPEGAEPLCIQVQWRDPQLWALVDPTKPLAPRKIRAFGTGHPIPPGENLRYLGTIQKQDGALVFHFFEVLPA